jgi:hypothetical protein
MYYMVSHDDDPAAIVGLGRGIDVLVQRIGKARR